MGVLNWSLARRTLFAALFAVVAVPGASVVSAADAKRDALPSWNDAAPKQAIVDFVRRLTTDGGADYVAPPDRIVPVQTVSEVML